MFKYGFMLVRNFHRHLAILQCLDGTGDPLSDVTMFSKSCAKCRIPGSFIGTIIGITHHFYSKRNKNLKNQICITVLAYIFLPLYEL